MDISETLSKAMRQAYSLGLNRQSDETQRTFVALIDSTREALFAHCKVVQDCEKYACSIAVWMTKMDAIADDADDKGVAGWLEEAERRVKRRGTGLDLVDEGEER